MRRSLSLFGCLLAAQTLDRIAVSVDNSAITERQLLEEIRITAFLSRTTPDLSPAARRAAAARLIDQLLLAREIEVSRMPRAGAAEAAPELKLEAARSGSREAFFKDLERYQLTESLLAERLAWQITVLRFIDFRFRPAVQLTEADLEARYHDFAREFRRTRQHEPPSFEQARAGLEKLLTEERVNQALERWLGEARSQAVIRYREQVFQ
jgi:hypothetical protein